MVILSRINIFILFLLHLTKLYFAIKPRFCPYALRNILPNTAQNVGDFCEHSQIELTCDPNIIYYTLDGSCNNLRSSSWGQANKPFSRMVEANFSDGSCTLRKGSDGLPLESSRKIRTTVLTNGETLSDVLNILFYAFGQWVDLDTARGDSTGVTSTTSSCCNGKAKAENSNPKICLPTMIPNDDPVYSKFDVTCIDHKRVLNTHHRGCKVHPCTPINSVTAFLDLSMLYGSSENSLKRLRSFKDGKLLDENSDEGDSDETFPPTAKGKEFCPRGGIDAGPDSHCSFAGDDRVNQNPEMTLFEIIFMRIHNYIATSLLKYNPNWKDERTFQESRRILIALYQHITISEYVPLLIGTVSASSYAILPTSKGYNTMYNPVINPQNTVEYAFASGRGLHSTVVGLVNYLDSDGKMTSYRLRDKFFNQRFLLSNNAFSKLMSVYLQKNLNRPGEHFIEELTDWVQIRPGEEYGFDLPALDIDRGRDAGVPTYNQMRQACGLCRLQNFEELADEIRETGDETKLKSLYKSVEDIDLYVGGLLEKPVKGSNFGPTFTCIIGENFYRRKYGDRLFYEFPAANFTIAQLETIRKATFTNLLCLSNPRLRYLPSNSFMTPKHGNTLIHCEKIAPLDLSVFKVG